MNIAYFSGEKWEEAYINERLSGHQLSIFEGAIQNYPDLRDEHTEILSVFVKSHVGGEEMDKFPNLKFIATRSTGYDHIDLAEAKRRNVTVSNVPTYGENTVAEFAFALLLAISRKVYISYERIVKTGRFSQHDLRGFDLSGKTIGVVGSGHIGRHSIRIAKGFGMNVVVFDPNKDLEFAKEVGFEYVEFDQLLASSDVITLHVPYNEHTHHMLNKDNVGKIKRGAYLINTSRGPLVETDALMYALKEGILAGAGLDVLEEEGESIKDHTELLYEAHPNPDALKLYLQNNYLIEHPGVIVAPHNAFNTQEALERILNTTIENVKAFSDGAPINTVAPKS